MQKDRLTGLNWLDLPFLCIFDPGLLLKGFQYLSTFLTDKNRKLDLMFMKHYAPIRCLYIKVAKLRTGVGSTETSYLQNCSLKLCKEHFKVQICKGRLFQKNEITFFLIFTN